uniref:MDIS1-interacting receptor like kinase 2-like n=1 Tax=Elaeis guineensis var. tenera TaxID=51953 RepID=A0A8N4F4J5_ELAGV|nr:MDIS1-interacting receptor like kinase 2-like [Elaeis guineensis]
MKTIPIQSFLLPLLLFISLSFLEAGAPSEAQALLKWKSSLSQPDALSSWSLANSTTPCGWFGVCCNSAGSIVKLSLPNANLNGTLHELDFASLPGLTKLNLHHNYLHGPILSNISALSQLTSLDLRTNQFHGSIPPEIGQLFEMVDLRLYINHLDGRIPAEIGSATKLQLLLLFINKLSGPIPPEIGRLANLQQLDLSIGNLN